LYITQAQI